MYPMHSADWTLHSVIRVRPGNRSAVSSNDGKGCTSIRQRALHCSDSEIQGFPGKPLRRV